MGRRRWVAEKMRKAAESVEKGGRPRPPPAAGPAPWLVFPNGKGRKKQTFYSLTEKRCYVRSIPEMRGKTCQASSHGWLVMLDDDLELGHCFLWNPDSLETIQLPQINSEDAYDVDECILSSPPPTHPDCLVLFLARRPSFFLFCRPGDKHWTKQHYQLEPVGDSENFIYRAIGCSSGIMYGYTLRGEFAIIDRTPNGCLSVRLLDVERLRNLPNVQMCESHLIESCRELFLVRIMFQGLNTHSVPTAAIYKLDFSGMVWVKVDSLGDRLLFLSHYSLSCSASESGMKGNCLYFTLDKDKSLYIFDVEDESVSVFLPCPALQTPWSSPYWVMPTANRLADSPRQDEQIITEDKQALTKQNKQENEETEECLLFNLPEELHKLFAEHLPLPVDYINFRAVCRKWLSVTPPIMWSTDLTRSTNQSPWLMFFREENGMCNFFDPMCNLTYCFDIPEVSGARICFSKDGWLLMARGYHSMFFFNPFTRKKINLPDLSRYYFFDGFSFSSLPTSLDCVVFGFIHDVAGIVSVSLLHLGDEVWTHIDYQDIRPFFASRCNPVFYDGAFYCLGQDGDLGVFDLKGGNVWTTLPSPQSPCSSSRQNYMVELNGEILSVFVGHLGRWIRVFRLDQSKMVWVHVKSLGDKMIFVSHSTSLLVTSTKRMQDKIYFPRFFSNNNGVFYSLGTAEYRSSFGDYSSEDFYNTKEQLHCTWIQPNLIWTIP